MLIKTFIKPCNVVKFTHFPIVDIYFFSNGVEK